MSGYNIGDEVFSGWKIVRPIGEGGFGRVFEVQKAGHGIAARSALKVVSIPPNDSMVKTALSEGQDEASVAAYFGDIADEFAQEVALVSSLEHPGIVDYKDHEILPHGDGMGWDVLLRMELLEPLTERMAKGALPQAEVARLGAEIADVLAYCHAKGIIHRDVKPGNVFVDGEGRCKLGDFGVARTADHTMGALSRKGTEDYMAPEVYRGDPYGAPADVYSLGIMLYQLLNGNRLPFLPPAPAAVGFHDRERARARRLAGEELPPIEGCDAGLNEAVAAACSSDPSLRPSATELRGLLGGLGFSGFQPQPVYGGQEAGFSGEAQEGHGLASQHTKGMWDAFAEKEKKAAEGEAHRRAEQERVERERREREERARREKAEREQAERARREKAEREQAERARREKAEREQAERERREHEEQERRERAKTARKPNRTPAIIGGVAALLVLVLVGVLISTHSTTLNIGIDSPTSLSVLRSRNGNPSVYFEGSLYGGYEIDLAKEVCARRGWNLVVTPVDYKTDELECVNQGDITCLWSELYEGHEDEYAWSGRYIANGSVAVVRADSDIHELSDLAGRVVATKEGSKALYHVKGQSDNIAEGTYAGGDFLVLTNDDEAFAKLKSGEVDAVACNPCVAGNMMEKEPGVYRQLDEWLKCAHLGAAFKKGDEGQALADQVTETLRAMDEDGTVKKICDRYADWDYDDFSYANWCLE